MSSKLRALLSIFESVKGKSFCPIENLKYCYAVHPKKKSNPRKLSVL